MGRLVEVGAQVARRLGMGCRGRSRAGLFRSRPVGASVGTVALAGLLVFAVPVTAEGLVAPVPLGLFVAGAVEAAAPEIAASTIVGPEGALIATTVVALGALAYATQDTWMPFVTGLFGAGGETQTPDTNPSTSFTWGVVVSGPTATFTFQSSASMVVYFDHKSAECKDLTTGALTTFNGGSANLGVNNTAVSPWTPCPGGSEIFGLTAGAHDGTRWAPEIHWGAPFNARTDAEYRVDVNCRKADGSSETISATTTNPGNPPTGFPGVGGGGLLVPSCGASWDGSHAEGMSVNGAQVGGVQRPLSSQTWATTSTLYPDCVGPGLHCTYVVEYLGAPCTVGQVGCTDWMRRAQTRPGDYQCKFGAYTMTLAQCAVDERAYETNGTTLTDLNTDGNPNTFDSPAPDWVPKTAPDGAPGGGPVATPGGEGCWPTGSAIWNPVDWVFLPVKCALSWAFIPTVTNLATGPIQTQLDRAGIAPSVAALNDAVGTLGGSPSGCTGPEIHFDIEPVHQVVTPFNACAAPMSTVAGFAYALIGLSVCIGGALKILQLVAAGFGYAVAPNGSSVDKIA